MLANPYASMTVGCCPNLKPWVQVGSKTPIFTGFFTAFAQLSPLISLLLSCERLGS